VTGRRLGRKSSRGLLIVISGPGGVGKDTLIQMLRARNPHLCYSVSYTTRPVRPNEVPGEHYTFVDVPAFHQLAESGELLEHAVVNGHLYGTSSRRVAEIQETGCDLILKIDVQGAEQVRQKRPDGVYVFIAPPDMEELLRRRAVRGAESAEEMQARQELSEVEMSYAGSYDHIVVNDDAERAVSEIEAILEQERRKRHAA
jgi:guanylate kinase